MAKIEARILSVAVACLLATAASADETRDVGAATQTPTGLVGERVRLSGPPFATSDNPLIGRVVTVDADSIKVIKNRTGETIRIPFSAIKGLDVARPQWRSHAGTGALIGAAIPATALLVVVLNSSNERGGEMSGVGYAAAAYMCLAAVPPAALIGAVIGSGFHSQTDRWEPVATRRVRVSVLPDFHGGVRGGLSVRF